MHNPLHCLAIVVSWGIIYTGLILWTNKDNIDLGFDFGPSPERKFLSVNVDNWYSWIIIAFFIMLDKFINSYCSDIINSWITNTIADHKCKKVDFSPLVCRLIVGVYYGYYGLRYIFVLHLIMSQTDYAILRVLADVIASDYTTKFRLKYKIE